MSHIKKKKKILYDFIYIIFYYPLHIGAAVKLITLYWV